MNGLSTSRILLRPCTWVYVALMALTVVTWAVGRAGLSGLGLSMLVLGLALLKGGLVGDWFMGLRQVGGTWRWVVIIWLLIPGSLIAIAFMLSYVN